MCVFICVYIRTCVCGDLFYALIQIYFQNSGWYAERVWCVATGRMGKQREHMNEAFWEDLGENE